MLKSNSIKDNLVYNPLNIIKVAAQTSLKTSFPYFSPKFINISKYLYSIILSNVLGCNNFIAQLLTLMNSIITNAIENRQLLSFNYDDLFRIVEPHCFGLSPKGKKVLRAYQVDGESSSGFYGWKLYDLTKMSNILLLDQSFPSLRSGYNKGDKGMIEIYIEL